MSDDATERLRRRVKRIEDELGIDPWADELERRAQAFCHHHSFYTFNGITKRGASITVDGDFTRQMLGDIENEFEWWEFQPDSQTLIVRDDPGETFNPNEPV